MADSEPDAVLQYKQRVQAEYDDLRIQEEKRKQERERYKETFEFGDGFVHVEVNPDELRRDFVAEAVKQGVEEDEARGFSNRVSFFWPEKHGYKSWNGDDFVGDITVLIPQDEKKILNENIGFVEALRSRGPNREHDRYVCGLGISRIVEFAKEPGKIKGKPYLNRLFKMEDNTPWEARRSAVSQFLSLVWRHERQHLIQWCNGNNEKWREDANNKQKPNAPDLDVEGGKVWLSALTSIGMGVATYAGNYTDLGSASLIGASFAITIKSLQNYLEMAKQMMTEVDDVPRWEVDARKFEDHANFNPAHPFKIEFEDS